MFLYYTSLHPCDYFKVSHIDKGNDVQFLEQVYHYQDRLYTQKIALIQKETQTHHRANDKQQSVTLLFG